MDLSVIIPSRTSRNILACLGAVLENDSDARRIVVDDGIEWDSETWPEIGEPWCNRLSGVKPFVYARNCNLGITSADNDDVVLLNDDALLQTPGGFSILQQAADQHPEFGLIAATCNNVGNRNQWPHGIGLREDPRMVCFVAVLIPRRTVDAVGMLDERFTGYGFDDDDYCLRVRRAGLKIGIHDGCFVDHGSLKSTFRGESSASGSLDAGRRIFIEKWGAHPL